MLILWPFGAKIEIAIKIRSIAQPYCAVTQRSGTPSDTHLSLGGVLAFPWDGLKKIRMTNNEFKIERREGWSMKSKLLRTDFLDLCSLYRLWLYGDKVFAWVTDQVIPSSLCRAWTNVRFWSLMDEKAWECVFLGLVQYLPLRCCHWYDWVDVPCLAMIPCDNLAEYRNTEQNTQGPSSPRDSERMVVKTAISLPRTLAVGVVGRTRRVLSSPNCRKMRFSVQGARDLGRE